MIKHKKYYFYFLALLIAGTLCGCATSTMQKPFEMTESQVKLRSIQTRAFDTTDKKNMMQAVISTMQDLDFVIDKADYVLGAVTGTKFYGNSAVVMTVTVRPRGEKQLLVRANAQRGIVSVEDPKTYQDFFIALEKALFLSAQQVD